MVYNSFFWILFTVLALLAFLHIYGLNNFLYWQYWWYDIVTHFLGGFWVGGMVLLFFSLKRGMVLQSEKRPYTIAGVVVFVVASLWEIMEYLIGAIEVSRKAHIEDTTLDLIVGVLGAFVAVSFLLERLRSGVSKV